MKNNLKAWFTLTLFACRQRNFSHGTYAEWWNERNRTKKYLSLCSHLKFKYFNFCEIFLQQNQSDFFWVTWTFHEDKKFWQNGRHTALSDLREDRPQYIVKTRITELQISFRLRQFFAGTLIKWRLIFLPRYFSLTKDSVNDRRKMWMEIRLKLRLFNKMISSSNRRSR